MPGGPNSDSDNQFCLRHNIYICSLNFSKKRRKKRHSKTHSEVATEVQSIFRQMNKM